GRLPFLAVSDYNIPVLGSPFFNRGGKSMRTLLAMVLLLSCAGTGSAADAKAPEAAAPDPVSKSEGGFDVGALDRSVDPCADFDQFAGGRGGTATPTPADQSRWGQFSLLAERNRNILHDILEAAKDPRPSRSALERQTGDYYAACMDEAGVEKLGTKPIEPV